MKQLTLAIDFDHTIVDTDDVTCWEKPVILGFREDAEEVLRKLHNDGHIIIIHTCRSAHNLVKALDWLDDNNVHYDYVNCNAPNVNRPFSHESRKIFADFYIDDRNIGGLPSWKEIYNIVNEYANR